MLKGVLPVAAAFFLLLPRPCGGSGPGAGGSAAAGIGTEKTLLAFFGGGKGDRGILKKGERSTATSILSELKEEAELLFFTKADRCKECDNIERLLVELSALSEKLSHEVLPLDANPERAASLGVARAPAIVVAGKGGRDYGIRYYGLPLGFEFEAFLRAIVNTAHGTAGLDPETVAGLGLVASPVTVTVFVARH